MNIFFLFVIRFSAKINDNEIKIDIFKYPNKNTSTTIRSHYMVIYDKMWMIMFSNVKQLDFGCMY